MAEPVATISAILATLLKAALSYLPGAVGAAVSLKFLGGELNRAEKWISFAVGLACAVYIAPAISAYCGQSGTDMDACIKFLVGLFGLATMRELFTEIRNADIIGALKRKYLGGGDTGGEK